MSRRHWIALALALVGPLPARGTVGTADGYGYTWADQDEPYVDNRFPPSTGPLSFITVSEGGPMSPEYPLGFPFPFYDATYSTFRASDNGWITLEGTYTGDTHRAPIGLPSASAPRLLIAPLWADLQPAAGATSFWYQPFEGGAHFRYSARLVGSSDVLQVHMGLYASGVIKIWYEILTGPASNFGVGIQKDGAAQPTWGHTPWLTGTGTFALADDAVLMFFPPKRLGCAVPAPESLPCDARVPATSPATVSPNVTQYTCSPYQYFGRERVFVLDNPGITHLGLTLETTLPIDLDVMLLNVSECSEHRCIAWGDDAIDMTFLPPGRYHVVIDGRADTDVGSFDLISDCEAKGAVLSCGSWTSGANTGTSVWEDYPDCTTALLSGPEAAYEVSLAAPGNLRATLSAHSGNEVDVLIFPRDDLQPAACLAYGDEEAIVWNAPAGDYVVLVDGRDGASGSFNLDVACDVRLDCSAPLAALACQTPVPGSTIGQDDRVDRYSCSSDVFSGPEDVYSFRHGGGTVAFLLDGPADLQVQIVPAAGGCNEGTCLESGSPMLAEDLPAGDYFVVVDGRNGTGADYTLTPLCATALEPAALEVTIAEGECVTETKTVYLSPALRQVDVLFAIDASANQAPVLPKLSGIADAIAADLARSGIDLAYGVVSLVDYVVAGTTCGDPTYGADTDYPYRLDQAITADIDPVKAALDSLVAENGGDLAESYTRAWFETYTDPTIGWRPGSRRVVIMTGDDVPHDCDPSECISGMSDPWGADPGPGGTLGDADDLAIMTVMQEVADRFELPIVLFTPTGIPLRTDGLNLGTIRDLWECWTRPGEGTVFDAGFGNFGAAGVAALGDWVRGSERTCRDLHLRASPGFEPWLRTVTPTSMADVPAPGRISFEIEICTPAATPPGVYSFDVELVCDGLVVSHQDVTAAASSCAFSPAAVVITGGTCAGASRTLDGRDSSIPGCTGPREYRWLDLFRDPVPGPAGTWDRGNLTYTVAPLFDTAYFFQFRCENQSECLGFGEVLVPVTVGKPVASAGPNVSACLDKPVTIGADCDPGYTYSWSPPTDLSSTTTCPTTVTPSTIPAPPWVDYTVTVTDTSGCTATDTVRVTVSGARTPDYVGNDVRGWRSGDNVNFDWPGGALVPPEYNVHRTALKGDLERTKIGAFLRAAVDTEAYTDVGAVPAAAGDRLFYEVYMRDCDGASIVDP